ncbi:hypothetical protein [Rhizobium halophilum]|uniref:hypothetical protein n=1 Tax=Rhizobium halophilum TaxID=2846852 RepID=UPI001EFD6E76|nr:hypothetical protein [Rhizobium halophilum]MCF6371026.1 hypothetical protein [Rhizobium halophilum]
MPSRSHDPTLNPAQIRGDIQQGLTGDKRPGFDPAMAPLETDSEAGGVPLSPEQIATATDTQSTQGSRLKSRNFDVAMGSSPGGVLERRPSLPALLPLIAVVVIGAAILIGVLLR